MRQIGKIDSIQETLPGGGQVIKTQTGFNFYYLGKCYAFHYNNDPNRENKCVCDGKVHLFRPKKEADVLAKFALDECKKKPIELITNSTDHGAQACIDHLLKKIAIIEKLNQPNSNQKITLLKSLVDEFKQFL